MIERSPKLNAMELVEIYSTAVTDTLICKYRELDIKDYIPFSILR